MVEGARPSDSATERIETPATAERDISSRSANVSARHDRRRGAGRILPFRARTPRIDVWCRPNSRAMACRDSPFCQRSHISAF